MAVSAIRIDTPTDFGSTLSFHEFAHSIVPKLNPEFEPAVRHTVDDIFNDLPDIDSGDPRMVSVFLDSIEQSLGLLQSFGLSLLAVMTSGELRMHDGSKVPDWRRVYYLVVPEGAYFRLGEEMTRPVHRFDPQCEKAMKTLIYSIQKHEGVMTFLNREVVVEHHEGNVPWCNICCMGEIIG